MSYCRFISGLQPADQVLHQQYHNERYGFPIHHDNELFGRLLLEINQAGLSWTTILNKEANFRKAYHQFNIKKVAAYTEKEKQRLLADAGIIRNRLKIDAAIYNAQAVQALQQQYGSFQQWLQYHHPLPLPEWMKLFKAHFKFTGGQIVNEFLMSTGYLPGAHDADCPVYKKVMASRPAWVQSQP